MKEPEYKKVVVRVGFINKNGDLEKEAVRVVEWDRNSVTPKDFMTFVEDMTMNLGADSIMTPGTSKN